jgi:hypothetical protein
MQLGFKFPACDPLTAATVQTQREGNIKILRKNKRIGLVLVGLDYHQKKINIYF